MSEKVLTPKEEKFCYYLVETNDRIKAIEESGYCLKIVAKVKNDKREYKYNEKHSLRQKAYLLLQEDHIKKEVKRLTDEKETFLKESGVTTQYDVLKWFSDVMTGKYQESNIFLLQQQIVAGKELLGYYTALKKNLGKDSNMTDNLKETKKFIINYVEEVKGDDSNGSST